MNLETIKSSLRRRARIAESQKTCQLLERAAAMRAGIFEDLLKRSGTEFLQPGEIGKFFWVVLE